MAEDAPCAQNQPLQTINTTEDTHKSHNIKVTITGPHQC